MLTSVAESAGSAILPDDLEEAVQRNDLRTRTEELARLKAVIREGPSVEATAAQRAKGKLTVRERIELLFDEGTFVEIEAFRKHRATAFGLASKRPHTDGVVVGWGLVHGQKVFAYAHDFRMFGGALGEAHAAKIHKLMDMALAAGARWSACATGRGPVSRKASRRSPATAGSSAATPRRPASSRRSA